ncbi:MAG TPA: sugar ABC transporter substrate-binding protein [Burkholderiales bacterium]|nr:sugar ABC transporter substrate-binding protein [Burkholderiales bacterium]
MWLAVFTKNRTNPAYAAARLGADRTAQAFGVGTRHYVPQKPDDVAEQIALIDEALKQRPDAFLVVPVHPTGVNEALRKIAAAGVPLIGYLNRYTEPGPISFVGSDDHALGVRIATYLYEHLGGAGNVLIVEGPRESVTSLDRLRGFRDAQKKFSKIRFVGTICGEYQRPDTLAAVAAFLESGVPFDAVLAANDVMALAAIEAVEAVGRTSVVVGVNAVPDAIQSIKEGKLLATMDFDALKIAGVATEAAIRHLRGEAVPREIMLPVQVVDRSNYAEWDKPFEERALVRWEDAVRGAT